MSKKFLFLFKMWNWPKGDPLLTVGRVYNLAVLTEAGDEFEDWFPGKYRVIGITSGRGNFKGPYMYKRFRVERGAAPFFEDRTINIEQNMRTGQMNFDAPPVRHTHPTSIIKYYQLQNASGDVVVVLADQLIKLGDSSSAVSGLR